MLARRMDATSQEFRFYVYVEAKRGVKPQDVLEQLRSVFGESSPSQAFVYKYHKEYTSGQRQSTQHLPHPGRPVSQRRVGDISRVFLEKRKLLRVKQSPYSLDFNQCDRWLFKLLKRGLQDHNLDSAEDVLNGALEIFRQIPATRFQHELDNLRIHCHSVIKVNGDYVTK